MKLNPVAERLLRIHKSMVRFRGRKTTSVDLSKSCRICLESTLDPEDQWIEPCSCRGTVQWVHHECLKIWIQVSDRKTCDICNSEYRVKADTSIFKQYSQQICWALTCGIILGCFFLSKRAFGFRTIWSSQYIRLTYICIALILTVLDIALSYLCPDFYTEVNLALGGDSMYQENLVFVFVYMHRILSCLYAKIPWQNDIQIQSVNS